ncbi:WGR domain-containing protein, predicted DNA-binding domain in MolR [Tistlia consotensis]|uniref:WGR domain-containing protein, predicted DNA-binding domain in MolR n=1 Tax=Tistlia consotensis USBA 355 TaxID=560819 RepID=A0A1Y6BYL7_9PROT|nr:WGR domain-containing protein [Tistlia consotensis]SMF26919.1 WGR domain-containing protein, predicted DNA-binding domain in MolR [Tistlia consotensis USBA 355]SNR66704.1 WGR domain-containing protein, predicted DNA-binding domain in MolR [Tistlia consotensis]
MPVPPSDPSLPGESTSPASAWPAPIDLRRVEPARNCFRFYRLVVQQDLFGSPSLLREWGRIGQSGRTLEQPCPSLQDALAARCDLLDRKRRRGYRVA